SLMNIKKRLFTMYGKSKKFELNFIKYEDKRLLPMRITLGGFPVAVVDDTVYQQLAADFDPEVENEFSVYVGFDIDKSSDLNKANQIFNDLNLGQWAGHESQLDAFMKQKMIMGLIMFIVGYLGLTFLITSGCILYFMQMYEGSEVKYIYSSLRRLVFSTT